MRLAIRNKRQKGRSLREGPDRRWRWGPLGRDMRSRAEPGGSGGRRVLNLREHVGVGVLTRGGGSLHLLSRLHVSEYPPPQRLPASVRFSFHSVSGCNAEKRFILWSPAVSCCAPIRSYRDGGEASADACDPGEREEVPYQPTVPSCTRRYRAALSSRTKSASFPGGSSTGSHRSCGSREE